MLKSITTRPDPPRPAAVPFVPFHLKHKQTRLESCTNVE